MPAESGQMLSHYRLVEKIGEGGMGVVWKAEDSILGRTVAIKVLPADVSRDDERRKMFLEEARQASSVSEAHIVQVFEFGREGSLDFIVMEYVDGKPLDQFLLGRPLSSQKLARIGLQIAQALSKRLGVEAGRLGCLAYQGCRSGFGFASHEANSRPHEDEKGAG